MDIATQLNVFAQLSKECREKSGNLLIKIFSNILKYPNDDKYRDLNLNKICKRLNESKICIDLLLSAGFENSMDGDRLLFSNNKSVNTLKLIHNNLLQIMSNNDTEEAIQELINDGLSMKEAKQAIHLSLGQNDNIQEEEQKYLSNEVNKLIEMGFDKNMANCAMKQCHNDINAAIQYLVSIDSLLPDLGGADILNNYIDSLDSPQQIPFFVTKLMDRVTVEKKSVFKEDLYDLSHHIKKSDICFVDESKSTLPKELLISKKTVDHNLYVINNKGKPIVIVIYFDEKVDIKSITFYSLFGTINSIDNLKRYKSIYIHRIDSIEDFDKDNPNWKIKNHQTSVIKGVVDLIFCFCAKTGSVP